LGSQGDKLALAQHAANPKAIDCPQDFDFQQKPQVSGKMSRELT
jgi:hypothetical protein